MTALATVFGEDADVARDRAFQLLLLANITSPLGPALVSPLLDTLTGTFSTTESQIGLMVAAYTAPGIVVIPLIGILSDRYGRKPILVTGLIVFGLSGAAITLTTDFRLVLALRLLQGVGGAGIVPVIITAIGDLYRGAEEATAQGLRLATSGLTQAVFPAIAGFLVVVAWQYPLLLYAIALPIAVAVAVWLEEPSGRDAVRLVGDGGPGAGPDAGQSGDGEGSGDGSQREPPVEEASLVRPPNRSAVAAVVVGAGIPVFFSLRSVNYNFIGVVRVLDGTPAEAGLLVALGSLTYATAASQAGRVTAHFDSRVTPMVGMFVALGVGMGLIALAPTVLLSGVGVVAIGAGFGMLGSLYRSIMTGLAPGQLRGGLVSLSESVGRIGITTVPIVMGAAIAFLRPTLGLPAAVRLTVAGVGVLAAVVGVTTVILGEVDPVPTPGTDS